jgi:amino acid adenylation domain-containing protein
LFQAQLAYIIFTSGSTGRPKGVPVPHAGAVHLVDRARERVGFGAGDVWTLVHSFGFDFSVWEIWGALSQGGTLVVVPLDVAQAPHQLAELIRRESVSVLNQTPSAIRALTEILAPGSLPGSLPSLRRVICGGEAFPRELADELLGWGVPLWAFYGPTESTVWAAAGQVEAGEGGAGSVPLGRPLADHRLYVLDDGLAPVPVNVSGELHIAGPGLARGYFGDPALTAERFVPDPFGEAGERLYRTGDLVRRLPSGALDFLGRIDHQVKLRGFRIELGEIEAVLARHPAVAEAAVLLRRDLPGGDGLVAYAVPSAGSSAGAAEFQSYLAQRLPAYMVPAAFQILGSMPRSANGKLDRKALAALSLERTDGGAAKAPRTPAEELVAGIFTEALHLDRVGIEESFFELGGHSLLATHVAARVRALFSVELPLRTIFEAPTVAALAARIERRLAGGPDRTPERSPAIQPVQREGRLPLSFAQHRVWLLEQLQPGTALFNIPLAVRLRGELDRGLLTAALAEVVRRHETLRTAFHEVNGEPVPVFSPSAAPAFPIIDLQGLPAAAREREAERLALAEAQRPFDLGRSALFRSILIVLAAGEHLTLLTLHQLVGDGRSMRLLIGELGALYTAFRAGRPSPLPALAVQYADFAAWQRRHLSGDLLESELAWWRATLTGMPRVLDLPADHPRPPVRSVRGAVRTFAIERKTLDGLSKLSRQHGTTLFMILLAGFAALLQRVSGDGGQDDLAVGTPFAGRVRPETEPLIGFFLNTLALRVDLTGSPDLPALLQRVRETTLAAHAHQEIPFERLAEDLAPDQDLSRPPLVQVRFALRNAGAPILELPGFGLEVSPVPTGTAKLELTCSLTETDHGLAGTFTYARDLFDGPTIERLAAHFGRLLAAVVADPYRPLAELPLLSSGERHQLLTEWNDDGRAQVYVLDKRLEPVPLGCWGELYIAGGNGLTQGDQRLVRTGEIVRRLPNGDLELRSPGREEAAAEIDVAEGVGWS